MTVRVISLQRNRFTANETSNGVICEHLSHCTSSVIQYFIMGKSKGGKCCNPFNTKHKAFETVYDVTEKVINRAKEHNIKLHGKSICISCRTAIYRLNERQKNIATEPELMNVAEPEAMNVDEPGTYKQSPKLNDPLDDPSSESSDDTFNTPPADAATIKNVKQCVKSLCLALQLEEIDDRKMRGTKYQSETLTKLMKSMQKVYFPNADDLIASSEIIVQLRKKFEESNDRKMKIKILSVLPTQWSIRKIQNLFGESASKHMITQTKNLVQKNGILCDATKKIGSKTLDESTLIKVHGFYRSDDISRACPGMREFVKKYDENGTVEKVQRRLVLMNLREAFELFKSENPNDKIGFSKFASLRPPECVLAGSTHGVHTTCVCTYHQNVKLIFDALIKNRLINGKDSFRDLFEHMLCDEITEKCYLNECVLCPGTYGNEEKEGIREILLKNFEENLIEEVTFKQWITVGGLSSFYLKLFISIFIYLFIYFRFHKVGKYSTGI